MIDNKTIRKMIMLNKMLPSGSPTYENREAEGAVANFTTNVAMPFVSLDCEILPIQEGTGTPSPSNPRPVSGTNELTLNHKGKNLFDVSRYSDYEAISAYKVLKNALPNDVLLIMSFTDKDTSVNISDVYFGFVLNSYNGGLLQQNQFHWALQNGTVRARTDNQSEDLTTLCSGIIIYPATEDTYNRLTARYDIQIELGSTATTYEPYNAETYTIDLGQEIMGGTADVVGGTGEETWGVIDLSNVQWSITTNRAITTELRGIIKPPLNNNVPSEAIAEKYSVIAWAESLNDHQTSYGVASDGTVVFYYDGTTPTGLFVYPLATPTEYTFTGQPINSYLGVNNVWTDSGDTKVTYKTRKGRSSTKKYLPIFYDFYGKEKYK